MRSSRRAYALTLSAAVAGPFLVSRAVVWVGTELGARLLQPAPHKLDLTIAAPLAPFFRWDSHYYLDIARFGYLSGPAGVTPASQRVAFFPLYPFVGRLGGASDWAMFIIPNLCFLAGLALLYLLARRYLDPDAAVLANWIAALGPAAMFFSYPYSESLFLLLAAACFLLLEANLWLPSALAGGLAALTRPPGFLLALAFVAQGWRPTVSAGRQARRGLWLLAALGPLAGLGALAVIDWVQAGDPLAFLKAQASWVGPPRNPLYPIGTLGLAVLRLDPFRPEAIALPVLLAFAAGAVWVWRRLPLAYGLFTVAMVVLAAREALYLNSFFSVPRYLVVVFPCYLAFAAFLARRRNLQVAWLVSSASVLMLNSALYSSWRFIG